MTTPTDDAIRAYAADLLRAYAAGFDYLDLAEHMFDDDTIGDIRIADLDGPDIDDLQKRILDAVHAWGNAEPHADALAPGDNPGGERLAEITNRNRRLLATSFTTHGMGHGCPACDLVRAIDDVQWLLEQVRITATLREEWGYRWGNGDLEQRAEGYDTEADARIGAHHSDTIMRRYVTDWEDVQTKDASKDGDRG